MPIQPQHEEIVQILMDRDGYSYDEAVCAVEDCAELMEEALDFGDDPCEVLADVLGLEPDYVMDVMGL